MARGRHRAAFASFRIGQELALEILGQMFTSLRHLTSNNANLGGIYLSNLIVKLDSIIFSLYHELVRGNHRAISPGCVSRAPIRDIPVHGCDASRFR